MPDIEAGTDQTETGARIVRWEILAGVPGERRLHIDALPAGGSYNRADEGERGREGMRLEQE